MKWIVGALVIGLIGYLVYRWTRPSPERKACDRVVELCGGGKQAREQCADGVKQIKKAVGEKAVEQFAACTAESKSCADAMGCAAGTALKSGAGEILRGLDRAIHQ